MRRLSPVVLSALLAALAAACGDDGGAVASGDIATTADHGADAGGDTRDETPDVVESPDEGGADASDAGEDVPLVPDIADVTDVTETVDVPVIPDVPEVEDAPEVPDAGDTADGEDTADVQDDAVEPECVAHADCADALPCTKDLCVEGACENPAVSCDDGDPCTEDSCEDLTGCVNGFTGGDACVEVTQLFHADFDDGTLQGLTVEDVSGQGATEPVLWRPDPMRTFAGAGALYFGRPGAYDYDLDQIVASVARTPAVALPGGKEARLRFWLWADVEEGGDWDVVSVSVIPAGGESVAVWAKSADNVVMLEWQQVEVDLTAFAGSEIEVEVLFHSIDHTFNDTTGVIVDSLLIAGLPAAKGCAQNADCDDGVACTTESCEDGQCAYVVADACCATSADCDDANACTIELCQVGQCMTFDVADPACCNTVADCDDDNLCTDDVCGGNNRCQHTVKDDPGCCTKTSDCNDGDSCTIDSCQDFICLNVNTCCQSDEECNDGDDVCTVDTCVDGECKFSYKPIPGCCSPVLFEDAFEDDLGWSVAGNGGACGWNLFSGGQSKSPDAAMYYGNPATKNYECGASSGTATSEPIHLPGKDGLSVEFDVWFDVEGGGYDLIEVRILDGSKTDKVWSKSSPYVTWQHQKISLDAYKGKEIQVQLWFDSVDSIDNGGEGVYFDNVMITDPCE